MTGDSRPPAPEGGWGLRIGVFERHYPGWRIGSPDGVHYTAQHRTSGRARGPRLRARTLDELADLIEAAATAAPDG